MKNNILLALFDIDSEAYEAFSKMKNELNGNESILQQAALIKREDIGLKIKESIHLNDNTYDDTLAGGMIGALIGVITGPLGILLWGGLGALIGSYFDLNDAEKTGLLLDSVAQKICCGKIGLIAFIKESNEDIANNLLSKFSHTKQRWDGDELLREIKQGHEIEKELAAEARQKMKDNKKKSQEAAKDTLEFINVTPVATPLTTSSSAAIDAGRAMPVDALRSKDEHLD